MTNCVATVSVSSSAPSARERDLAAVGPDVLRALGQDEEGLAAVDDRHQHGGLHQRSSDHHAPLPRAKALPRQRDQALHRQHRYVVTKPPSTFSAWPVMPADSGSARNTATRAISSGSIMRRCATWRL
jgi:hypothetical protein